YLFTVPMSYLLPTDSADEALIVRVARTRFVCPCLFKGENEMQILGTVSGQGNKNADGLERLTVVIKKGDAKVIPYQEGGEITINLFIGNDSYQAKMRTDRSYVYITPAIYDKNGKKTYLQNIFQTKGIEKNQKVELEVDGANIRLTLIQSSPSVHRMKIFTHCGTFRSAQPDGISNSMQERKSHLVCKPGNEQSANTTDISIPFKIPEDKNKYYAYLWDKICAQLNSGIPNWQEKIIKFIRVATENREKGKRWTDNEIFEGFVKAILSSNTDWAKIERILPELQQLFHDFALDYYASLNKCDVENEIHPWFIVRKANSQSLKSNLIRLIKTAKELIGYSQKYGCLDNFINALLKANDSDPKSLALQFGSAGRRYKLSGMGIPIASEALRNIGFDMAKPDRHINRSLGCFGLVKFDKWSESYINSEGKKATRFIEVNEPLNDYSYPEAGESKSLEVMKTMEAFAKSIKIRSVLLDYAIWLLCAKSGLYTKNQELRRLAFSCDM
ncbi:MAG: hypothetical protein AABY84_11100, partial [Candidatus Firestonebacteria bacterium]